MALIGGLGGEAADVLGRDVDLLELGEVALLIHGVVDGLETIHVDLARGAVDGDLGAPVELEDLGIGLGQGRLETVKQVELIDVLFLAQKHKCFHHGHIGVCHLTSLP